MRLRSLRSLCACLAAGTLLAALPACSMLPWRKRAAPPAPAASESGKIGKKATARGLTAEVKASPDPVKLGETRQIEVTLTIHNDTKKTVSLKFATTQLIEILLREVDSGKVVSQWSTDQTFTALNRYLVINPKERLEYVQPITTRDLKAGRTYNLEAYLVGYDQELRASRPIIPQP